MCCGNISKGHLNYMDTIPFKVFAETGGAEAAVLLFLDGLNNFHLFDSKSFNFLLKATIFFH